MGHNVDLGVFGMCSIRCKGCGKDLDLSEVDIDCDINTHNPMCFELNLQCYQCDEENEIKFSIKEEKMSNPEFDKALKESLGNAYDLLKCQECNVEFILCPHCGEALCPSGCNPPKKR